jgi:AmmeMemoRadiSam system protein B
MITGTIRPATQANRFYTGDAKELENEVDSLLMRHNSSQVYDNLAALIVPHAGYYFSGNVAAAAYMAIDTKKRYKRIFLLGPSHHEWLNGTSVNTEADYYATPLGNVKVDHETAINLTKADSIFTYHRSAHAQEHCLEVQLPFLQCRLGDVPPIVPIIISTNDYYKLKRMADVLNRRSFVTLVYSGAFDSFGYKRSQFFLPCKNGELFIDEVVKYAGLYRNDQLDSANSLFGEVEELKPVRPEVPTFSGEEDVLALLQQEKEYVGMYLSSHPLDRYRFEIETFADCRLTKLQERIDECERADKAGKASVAGIVTDIKTLTTRTGTPGARVMMEDFDGSYEFALFGKDYETWLPYMQQHAQLYIEGEIAARYFVKPEERAQGKRAPYGFKIKKISLLGNLNDSLLTGFAIVLDSDRLSADFRSRLVKILKAHKGNTPLSLYLHDKNTGYNLEFQSRKFSVGVSKPFIDALQKLGVQYSVSHK